MSSTMESKSNKHTRVSTFDVTPSVALVIGDEEGNLDEKKAVAAVSQTRDTNKHLWMGIFVLIGVVVILIAANIGTSVAVARLTRQLNVDPVTGMATIAGSDDVVMKTSIARYKEEDVSFHIVPFDNLSAVKTVEFNGYISLDVKGFARMTNDTILFVEGGSLIFDVNGFKNITGDQLTRVFSSIVEDMESSDLDGRRLGMFDTLDAMLVTGFSSSETTFSGMVKSAFTSSATPPAPVSPCYPLTGDNRCGAHRRGPGFIHYACPSHLPYCNEANFWCGSTEAHRTAQESTEHDYAPHCSF